MFDVDIYVTQKAQYVEGGYLAYPPYSVTYASVV